MSHPHARPAFPGEHMVLVFAVFGDQTKAQPHGPFSSRDIAESYALAIGGKVIDKGATDKRLPWIEIRPLPEGGNV